MKLSLNSSFALLIYATFATTVTAAIVTSPAQTYQTDYFSAHAYYSMYDVGVGSIIDGQGENITGFKKFDASLGTLQGVKLTYEFSGAIEVYAYAYGYDTEAPDSGGSFDFEFSGFDSFIDITTIYSPSNDPNGYGYTGVSGSAFFSPLGMTGMDVDDYLYNYDDGSEFDYYDEYYDEIDETAMNTLSVSGPNFDITDFVGDPNETVDTLYAQLYIDINESDFTINGIGNSEFEVYFDVYLYPGDITLEYIYDDAISIIPEPSAVTALLALCSLLSLSFHRRR
jgi:hypothetical protein